jgi:hypothetical protein
VNEFERCPTDYLTTQAELAEAIGLDPAQVRHFSRGVEPTWTFGRTRVYNYAAQYKILCNVADADRATRRGPKMSCPHVWRLIDCYRKALDAYCDRLDREEKVLIEAGLRQPEAEEQLEEATP